MATNTEHYSLKMPDETDFYDVADQNSNMAIADAALHSFEIGKEPVLSGAAGKVTPTDADAVVLVDSADSKKTKGITWANIKTALGKIFAAITHKHAIADVTDLSASLSNKATIHTSFAAIGLTESTATLDRIVAALDDGAELFIAIGTIGASTGLVPATYGLLTVKKYSPNYAECDYRRLGGPRWYGYYNAGQTGTNQWTGWIPLATATPPTEYDLPLAKGMIVATATTSSTYSKSQDGLVVVQYQVVKTDGSDFGTNTITVATLPKGFRPSLYVHTAVPIGYSGTSFTTDTALCYVSPTGDIRLYKPPAGATAAAGMLVFYAAS